MIFIIILGFIAGGVAYLHSAEQFGAQPEGEHLRHIAESPQYHDGRFRNINGADVEMSFSKGMEAMYEMITAKNTKPSHPLPTDFPVAWGEPPADDGSYAVTWFGHSAVMLELDGKRLLLDPMLSGAASPLPIFGKRFPLETGINLKDIPPVDAVLISHDHYDHLDHKSITILADRVGHFYVPLGVGAHLSRWGIEGKRITEMDWWDEAEIDGIRIAATPAQHFSGRSLNDRNKTLWASWVMQGRAIRIFFSGDSGYGPHFTEIGKRYGPFDFTMMECGQYNEKWRAIHSLPEESVEAHRDVQGKLMMPIHWGGFTLAPHEWTDPVVRVRKEAQRQGVILVTPRIGQRMFPADEQPQEAWWRE
ncbi:MBL fold metallo-hydrolase [bacterium]|nr:MBL fold metallo-hydrolase [bacterium]